MPIPPNEDDPRSGERKQPRRLKSVGSRVVKVPQAAASVASGTGRAARRYTGRTMRDLKAADLRFHRKPVDLAQAIAASAQATVAALASTAATAGTTAANKAGDLAGTAATEIANASGTATSQVLEHGQRFHEGCRNWVRALSQDVPITRENAEACAQAAAAAASAALVTLQSSVPSFADLSPAMKAKFVTAGMHGAWRPVDIAGAFYESSIPSWVRNLGEEAVLAFVDGKHASHIEAVVNAPGRIMDAANIVWERARDNLARGGADMTPLELAKANTLNALQAIGIVVAEALQTAAVAGCIGMALEGVVSVTENVIYVYKDQMTPREGARRVLKDMLKKGKASAIGGAGMTVVVALGAGPALATAAPVLVTVGGVVYVVTAYSRIKTALDSAEEVPALVPLDPPSLSPHAA